MKILMINKFLYPNGGSESYIFRLGEYLEKIGHEVQYFGMEHDGRCVGNNADQYTSQMDFHNGSMLSKITYPIKTIYSSEARKKIRKVLDDFSPDVCHLNNFNYQLTPSVILEIKKWEKDTGKKCKIIYTAHDYQLVCPDHLCRDSIKNTNCEKCLNGKFIKCAKSKCIHGSSVKSIIGMTEAYFWNSSGVYKNIDTIICCSNFMKSKLDSNPVLRTKTVVLHNFVNTTEHTEQNKMKYALYFGRFSEEKGVHTLINVCCQLPNIKFIFAGSGPLEAQISEASNIINVGFKTGAELATLISSAAFSITPSECYDNCPFSVMESQMFGTPVIGANIGGIPELIKNGETGELFESGNESDLSEKIQKLWNDEELLKSYSANCKNTKFDNVEQYTEKLLKIYQQ